MKTDLLKKCLFVAVCIFAMHSLYGQSHDRIKFDEEPILNLKTTLFGKDTAKILRDNFLERFRLKPNHQGLNDIAGENISMMELKDSIYKKADSIRTAHPEVCSGKRCLTGVRITLGMEQNKVVVFFTPVYLKNNGTTNKEGDPLFDQGDETGPTYRYTGSSFTRATTTTAHSTYKRNISIRHFKNGTDFGDFQEKTNGSWKADTRDVIYSFQEIFLFYETVYNEETDITRYNGALDFHNAAPVFKRKPENIFVAAGNLLTRSRFKHSLFITKHGWDPEKDPFTTMKVLFNAAVDGADFAHLCPPGCANLAYKMQ